MGYAPRRWRICKYEIYHTVLHRNTSDAVSIRSVSGNTGRGMLLDEKRGMILDDWQREILEDETNHILLAKGRRIGATHIFAIKAVEWLMNHHNPHPTSQIVCSSITEDQAQLIIQFATNYAEKHYKQYLGKKANKPTLNRLILVVNKNRRILIAKPVGATGASARGFEGQVLMVDEGAFQPEAFWTAAKPILMTTGGRIWTWSTFNGRDERNYFWKSFEDAEIKKNPDARFKVWIKDSEQVIFNRPISESWTQKQKEEAIKHLQEERRDMSDMAYAQEYLAVAALDKRQFYSDEWIDKVCIVDEKAVVEKSGDFFGGFDLARMGGDQFTAEILKKIDNENIFQVDHFAKKMLLTTENENLIEEFTRKWNCIKSGIDAGSGTLGVSIYDHLQKVDYMKTRLVAMNNRSISMLREEIKQRLFNEDMHDNLRSMGEKGHIRLFNNDEIKASLRSVQWDLVQDSHGVSRIKIYGRFTHIAEGIKFAAWLAKEKSLKLFVSSIRI